MSSNRGMGRGLAAILSVSEAGEREGAELRELAVELVAPNPDQPRKRFDEDSLQALAESVKDRGVLQPVLVRPRPGGTYELVAGERRWRAAQLAGLQTLPALVQKRDDAHRPPALHRGAGETAAVGVVVGQQQGAAVALGQRAVLDEREGLVG